MWKERLLARPLTAAERRQLIRRSLLPGMPQIVILGVICYYAVLALGGNSYTFDVGPVSFDLIIGAVYGLIVSVVFWINIKAKSWQQSVRYSLVLAAIGVAVWLIASLVRGPGA